MANDLSKPLGLNSIRKSIWTRLPLGLAGAALLTMTISVAFSWVLFVHDPLGGEPITFVRIDRTKTGLGPKDVGVADIKKLNAKDPAKPVETAEGEDLGTDAPTPAPATAAPPPPKRPVVQMGEGQSLSTAAVPRISEKGRYGNLPKLAPDGTRPLDLYARPTPAQSASQARVVVVVTGLGLSQTGTQEAIRQLPPAVTLAFAPYGSSLDRWMQRARQEGHELLLQVPMEPFDYPDNDPGPHTLLTSLSAEQNLDRLQWLMSRVTNYVGIVNYTGAKFTAAPDSIGPVVRDIAQRGLMFLDDGSSSRSLSETAAQTERAPFARVDVTIDSATTEAGIDARLSQLESLARSKGIAVGIASGLPLSVRKITEWSKNLEARGVTLIPISASIKDGQM